jgi:hypothetical protein
LHANIENYEVAIFNKRRNIEFDPCFFRCCSPSDLPKCGLCAIGRGMKTVNREEGETRSRGGDESAAL